ncbi:MAG: hypothetical protein R2708_12685 [Vicinamibacterales bacterium]
MHIMPYDPRAPFRDRYVKHPPAYPAGAHQRVRQDALTLCRALGTTSLWWSSACEDGVPYAIDFMSPAPDADPHSVGQANFDWIVDKVAKFAVKKALEPAAPPAAVRRTCCGDRFGEPSGADRRTPACFW